MVLLKNGPVMSFALTYPEMKVCRRSSKGVAVIVKAGRELHVVWLGEMAGVECQRDTTGPCRRLKMHGEIRQHRPYTPKALHPHTGKATTVCQLQQHLRSVVCRVPEALPANPPPLEAFDAHSS